MSQIQLQESYPICIINILPQHVGCNIPRKASNLAEQRHDLSYPISPLVLLRLLLVDKLAIELLLDLQPNKHADMSRRNQLVFWSKQ